MFFEQTTKHV